MSEGGIFINSQHSKQADHGHYYVSEVNPNFDYLCGLFYIPVTL